MSNAGSSHQPLELTPLIQRSGGAPAPVDAGCDPDERTVISQRPPLPAASPARQTAPVELGKLLAGERLNHFELREFVGGGGMGAVFRAVDTMLNREVALKVLSRDQGADEETRRRFQNEAQSAARLDHENIARVYYVGEDRGLNYIVFEFIEGVNLRELVVERKGPL
ncbi:MAG: protein kinase, partial [Pirellulales bacterium]